MSKNKRGIQTPSRLLATAAIILLEIFLMVWAINSLSEKFIWLYTAAGIISIITVVYIVNSKGKQSYKILWIVFILIIPIFGVVTYMLFGGGRVLPYIKTRMKKSTDEYKKLLPSCEDVKSNLNYSDLMHFRQAQYLINESGYPVYKNTNSEFFAPGESLMPELLKKLENAKKYIFLEFFIIAEGEMWNDIFNILKRKVSEGVEVKIIFDDFGSVKYQSKDFLKNLKNAGIEVAVFNPIRPFIDLFLNNRNHRKIIVIDGITAFTGGINIADEYINKTQKFGYWFDSAIMLEGAAVESFLNMFCAMWKFTTNKSIDYASHKTDYILKNDGFYIPYCDSPLNDINPAEGVYLQILNNAQKYVYITSPYLILESNMISALCLAANSGVDVRIVTPHIPDKWYVHPVTQYYYEELLEAGVKIYEYTPGFIHSKLFLSDDNIATVGTVNIDYRSFYQHFECGCWLSGTESICDIKSTFEKIFEQAQLIDLNKWKKRPILLKIKQSILHLFAPFM